MDHLQSIIRSGDDSIEIGCSRKGAENGAAYGSYLGNKVAGSPGASTGYLIGAIIGAVFGPDDRLENDELEKDDHTEIQQLP
ncbi:glycine zipper 2TM domain-containing protein [Oceanobacillus salinisoli]|uniref:glycine zipper 2TM domain-containing protein n=1 Tax=Oceanobacillus salinisoli TaxID=2678611 RepID=UPI0012E247D5|nr:glycine zipper 2TM domain-containing protein [Oceanobacillus salinisoli]